MSRNIPAELMAMIEQGEGLTTEFSQSAAELTDDAFETVCAFSNRDGGHIFFGVRDDGEIPGLQEDRIEEMKKNIVASFSDLKRMYPPLDPRPVEYEAEGKRILYVYVPVSPSVSQFNGHIYERNGAGNTDITLDADLVHALYASKQDTYYVNKVYPVFKVSDLRHDLIERARKMAGIQTKGHPWQDMTDEQLLRDAKLILDDPRTGREGITLAAILLFGPDSLIASVNPPYKTDAILRAYNTDLYDDRGVVTTNLLDSFDRLMDFGKKHLNDIFTLDGYLCVSSRDHILWEIVSNLLAHRDYASGCTARFVIEKDRLFTENANRPYGYGKLDPESFTPCAKNPAISGVFREIGLAEGAGSGVRNTYKYTRLYAGAEPEFTEEGEMFRTVIPLSPAATVKVGPVMTGTARAAGDGAGDGTGGETGSPAGPNVKLDADRLNRLLAFCETERTKSEMMGFCGIRSDSYFRTNVLKPMLEAKMIRRIVPDKPSSPRQKYVRAHSQPR